MLFVDSIIMAVVVALLLPFTTNLVSRLRRIGKKASNEPLVRSVLLDLLAKLQCEVKYLDDNPANPFGTLGFTYQGGHFIATFPDNDDPFTNTVSISFFSCFSCQLVQTDIIEQVVNQVNNMALPIKCTMTPDEDADDEMEALRVSLHTSGIRLFDDDHSMEILKTLFSCFFRCQHTIAEQFESIKDIEPGDVFVNRHPYAKNLRAIAMAEMETQAEGWCKPWYAAPEWTVSELLERIMGHPVPYAYNILVFPPEFITENIDSPKDFKPFEAFMEKIGDNQGGTMSILVAPVEKDSDSNPMIQLVITLEKVEDKLIRFRVSYSRAAMEVTPYRPMGSPEAMPDARSFVVCVYPGGPEAFKAEVEYLTDEDEELANKCILGDAAYSLYWGRALFADGRYLEAEHYLRNAFDKMCKPMQYPDRMDSGTVDLFNELCFFLGTVYYHMGRFRESYYYLDFLIQHHRLRWTQQYVTTLQALNDPRVPSILKSLSEMVENADSDTPADELRDFIRRQYIIVDIRNGETEKARKALEEMLAEDPDSAFALQWLSKLI